MNQPYKLDADVAELMKRHSLLRFHPPNLLNGIVKLITDDGDELHAFHLQLELPSSYPFCFPLVTETKEDIPRKADRHVFTNTSHLCLGVKEEEIITCRHGINLNWFMDNVLIPRLAEEYVVINGGDYQREYDHGVEGRWQFFQKLFMINDRQVILSFLRMAIGEITYPNNVALCPCGSNKKFTKCHRKKIYELESSIRHTETDFWKRSIFTLYMSMENGY